MRARIDRRDVEPILQRLEILRLERVEVRAAHVRDARLRADGAHPVTFVDACAGAPRPMGGVP